MIDAVLLFGVLNCVFEFVLLCMVTPRWRCRALGSQAICSVMHVCMLLINLVVHWGTLVGSMSAILAFCASLITVSVAKALFGTVQDRTYRPGLIRYNVGELR